MHGGAGAVISVGLLRKVPLEFMESCIKSIRAPGRYKLAYIRVALGWCGKMGHGIEKSWW